MSYVARPNKPILPKRLAIVSNRGMGLYRRRGLGDLTTVDENGNILDASGNVIGNTATTPIPAGTPVVAQAESQSSLSTLAAQLAQQGLTIAGQILAPTATIKTGPQGTTIITPANASLPYNPATGGGGILSAGTATTVTGALPFLLLGGVVLILMLGAKK